MLKATCDRGKAEPLEDGVTHISPIFTPEQVGANLRHGWAFLGPGKVMAAHRHDDAVQLYVVYSGQGEARVGRAGAPLREFDALLVPPGAEHLIASTGYGELTLFWAIWKPVSPVLAGADGIAIERFDRARLKPAHMETFYHFEPFTTETMGGPKRFTTGWGLVGAGVASELHKHPTAELYVFFRGATVQQVGLECAAVQAGDSVLVPADTMHNLLNYAEREVLLYWIEVVPDSLPG